jgi:hypothetical protein
MLARFSIVTSRRTDWIWLRRKQPLLLPEMILRLRCGVVNPKGAEIRFTNQAAVARSGNPSSASLREILYQKAHSSKWRSLKLGELVFFLTGERLLTYPTQ